MDIKKVISILIALCIHTDGAHISLTDVPINQAILKGQSVNFTCHVDQPEVLASDGLVAFEECITDPGCLRISNDDRIVYSVSGGDLDREQRYFIHPSTSDGYVLQVANVSEEDAGKYRCLARNQASAQGQAELIMLGSSPICSTNASNLEPGDTINMTCHVTYQGRWAPIMTWTVDNSPIDWIINESTASSSMSTVIQDVSSADNGKVFQVLVHFGEPVGLSHNEATNTPSYEYSYRFEPLVVGGKNITVTKTTQSPRITTEYTTTGNNKFTTDSSVAVMNSISVPLFVTFLLCTYMA